MCQGMSTDEFSNNTQEELLNKLIKATEINPIWINSFRYEIHSLQDILPEEGTWDYVYYGCMSPLVMIRNSNMDHVNDYVSTLE